MLILHATPATGFQLPTRASAPGFPSSPVTRASAYRTPHLTLFLFWCWGSGRHLVYLSVDLPKWRFTSSSIRCPGWYLVVPELVPESIVMADGVSLLLFRLTANLHRIPQLAARLIPTPLPLLAVQLSPALCFPLAIRLTPAPDLSAVQPTFAWSPGCSLADISSWFLVGSLADIRLGSVRDLANFCPWFWFPSLLYLLNYHQTSSLPPPATHSSGHTVLCLHQPAAKSSGDSRL